MRSMSTVKVQQNEGMAIIWYSHAYANLILAALRWIHIHVHLKAYNLKKDIGINGIVSIKDMRNKAIDYSDFLQISYDDVYKIKVRFQNDQMFHRNFHVPMENGRKTTISDVPEPFGITR
ncbi:hypothetical protein CEXT_487421 [Caerostris extrusa]|uniref:Uncharacterized protein n=1 Tax=Caerostris extrusa TaxID=172846 RepID=A0AAV4T9I4_CAEEX|nr:hypothetical protein CEXT_487421 [Caerostris extrusa]